jgi:hypothetical protein
MAFRRRRSTFRGSTGSLGWIGWNRSCKDGTLGLGRCLRPLPGFHILGRTALETLLDCLVEKHVSGRAAQAATSDGNRIGEGSRPLFTRRRRCGISAVLTRHKRFENSTARIGPRKRPSLHDFMSSLSAIQKLVSCPIVPVLLRKDKSRSLDSPPPISTPKSTDRSLGTPELKCVWGPFPHPSDEDLSPGTPVRSG